MSLIGSPLTFDAVDDIGFLAMTRRLKAATSRPAFRASTLGPLLELVLSSKSNFPELPVAHLVSLGTAAPIVRALNSGQDTWVSPDARRMGFIRARRNGPNGDERLDGFLMAAQSAAQSISGLPQHESRQIAGAMAELEGNIHEHSMAFETGVLAFRAAQNRFEFVAVDQGIGVLRSLRRCAAFGEINDHGKALEAALTEGVSSYGANVGRGYGFRPIFEGLTNLNGTLRFRTGDQALLMRGTHPTLATAQLAQKPPIPGFFASVAVTTG